jgi:class 3 adenylate cyclase/tetratricopeptide (TPR) repeat protein
VPEAIGERRHLTVLFCDLVGSTAISAQLDPEEWRETLAGFHRTAAEAITRFDGYVAKNLGDGAMAYFGWPEAHDNDAERAARAGLAIVDAISKLNEQSGHAKLAIRIGIDSGLVVIGKGAGQEAEIFGDTPNIAARIETAAQPGTVAISDSTHRLVSGLFVVEDLGAQALKGIERPLQLYRVIRPSGMRGRFQAAKAAGGLTPFVGREDELRSLMSRWERAREGEGQVVTIVGEAGIGKSRLMQRFREEIATDPFTWLECATAPFFKNTPFYAVGDMLQQSFHWDASHDTEQRLTALEASLALAGIDPNEAVPLIAPLLGLAAGDRYPPLSLPPDQQRRRLLATLVGWTLGAAKTQPLVIATEDLHWADPSTLELTQLMVEQGATARLLLLYTARPEFHAPWTMRAHHTQITLNRLSVRDIRAMVAQVAASKALADDTVATMVERTGGVPLFVEELTRAVLESGDAKLTGREIPATLHDSLMARLDRLGPAKEVIQVGAVIGSEFSYELLHAVHPIAAADLQQALSRLADAELLYVRGIAPDATYQFKHALIRDAAYEALLKSRRKELHLTVAQAIDEKFPALKETRPEVLARHWTEAGEIEPAITEWQRAGEHALARGALVEAERHYRDAVGLLPELPESSERDSRELTLQVALGSVMQGTRGFSAPATAKAYTRARVLAQRLSNAESLQVIGGLEATALTQGNLRPALALAEQMLEIANRVSSESAHARALGALGLCHFLLGDLAQARQDFFEAARNYREQDFAGAIPWDPGVHALVWGAINLWYLGYPDQARDHAESACALSRRQNNPYSLALALGASGILFGFFGEFQHALEAQDETARLGIELGFPTRKAFGAISAAWARARLGETGVVERIREALKALDTAGFQAFRANLLRELSEAQALAGAIADALITIEQALQTNPDELIYRPELLLRRGELQLGLESDGEAHFEVAERDFRDAIEIARGMNAKSLELRATMSLTRLLVSQSRREEARSMLAAIYNWFTEGFDTADLKDAKALLDELSM